MIVLLETGINLSQCTWVCYNNRGKIFFPLCWSESAIIFPFLDFVIMLHSGIWTWLSLCLFGDLQESDTEKASNWLQSMYQSHRFTGCHVWGTVALCSTSTVSSHVDRLPFVDRALVSFFKRVKDILLSYSPQLVVGCCGHGDFVTHSFCWLLILRGTIGSLFIMYAVVRYAFNARR